MSDSTDLPENDSKESRIDRLNRMAAEGDILGIVDTLSTRGSGMSASFERKVIGEAISVARKKKKLTSDLLDVAIATDGELYLRLLLTCRRKLVSFDEHATGPRPDVPRDTLVEMDRLAQIEDRIIVLSRAQTSIQHVEVLAKHGPIGRSGRIVRIEDARTDQAAQA